MTILPILPNGDQESRRLSLLISDYEMTREDERSFLTLLAAVFTIATALVAAILTLLQQTCTFDATRQECYRLNEYFLAAVPLVPLACLAFLQAIGLLSIVRTYYLRALEAELQTYSLRPLEALTAISPASYMSIVNEITSLRRGRPTFRALVAIILAAAVFLFGGVSIYIAANVSLAPRLIMIAVYAPMTTLIAYELATIAFGGRGLFVSLCESYLRHKSASPLPTVSSTPPPSPSSSRSLAAYMVIPRPDDLAKSLIAPTIAVVLALLGTTTFDLHSLFFTILLFEVFVYPARYQWNDIRGYAKDVIHPRGSVKARLPFHPSRRTQRRIVSIVAFGILLRIGIALLLALLVGVFFPVLYLTLATGAASIAYEFARSRTGHPTLRRFDATALAIWLLVGAGYAIRAAIPFLSSPIEILSPIPLLTIAAITLAATMVVLLIWTLDGSSYCDGGYGTSYWRASRNLLEKPHLSSLIANLQAQPTIAPVNATGLFNGGYQKVLDDRGRFVTPWNVAGLFAIGSLTLTTVQLSGTNLREPVFASLSTAMAVLLFAALAVAPNTKWRGWILVGAVGATIILAFLIPTSLYASLSVLAISTSYNQLRASSFHDLRTAPTKAIASAKILGAALAKSFVGKATWNKIR